MVANGLSTRSTQDFKPTRSAPFSRGAQGAMRGVGAQKRMQLPRSLSRSRCTQLETGEAHRERTTRVCKTLERMPFFFLF